MSDFTRNFWSIYVVALTLGGIFGCLLLLWMTARKKVESAADNTTGHVWDEDLREMNNPMPRWWMWMFVITSIFGLGYLAIYPGLGKFAGMHGTIFKSEIAAAKPSKQIVGKGIGKGCNYPMDSDAEFEKRLRRYERKKQAEEAAAAAAAAGTMEA